MSPRQPLLTSLRLPLRLPLLVALAAWATLLSLESWWRLPAAGPERGLPERLVVEGRSFERLTGVQPSQPPRRALPQGLVLLEAADYRSGEALLQLRRLAHARTGNSGVMPVEAITTALVGSDGQGSCVGLDADGRVREALAQPRGAGERLAWLAGLRPYRFNSCLWLGSPQSGGHPAGAAAAAAPPAG
jgi:hypothetical protein